MYEWACMCVCVCVCVRVRACVCVCGDGAWVVSLCKDGLWTAAGWAPAWLRGEEEGRPTVSQHITLYEAGRIVSLGMWWWRHQRHRGQQYVFPFSCGSDLYPHLLIYVSLQFFDLPTRMHFQGHWCSQICWEQENALFNMFCWATSNNINVEDWYEHWASNMLFCIIYSITYYLIY